MYAKKLLVVLLSLTMTMPGVKGRELPTKKSFPKPESELYEAFKEPEAKYRPFVRWWWNGVRIEKKEILRELDLLKEAGIGGVEINSIRFPKHTDSLCYKAKPYLSDEWVDMMKCAIEGCKERGMVCDMIGGSGWPFGGEFLPRDKQLQMLSLETMDVDGGEEGTMLSVDKDSLLSTMNPPIMSLDKNPLKELLYIRIMPKNVDFFTPGIYCDDIVSDRILNVNVPAGKHVVYFFVKFTGYMDVIEGAPGAMGPVLNHFDKEAVRFYLDKLSGRLQLSSSEMKGMVRAAFVDSFELEGANWYDGILDDFSKKYGYMLEPYLPYIIRKVGHMGDPLKDVYGSVFSDDIFKNVIFRVRNDFERFQTDLFHDNFIKTLNEWCHENGLKSRVQCYGRGLHPLESTMQIDIPECETWIRKDMGRVMDDQQCYVGRANSFVNKYVASGSLLAGNGRVSCEEVTNVGRIFQTTIEELKIAGDQSNMSGVNHSILHGFNYSPQEAPFPGWIKFGTFFSEHNTLWPYFPYWFDYKARISAILQNSIPQSDIALLPPLEDMWSEYGQQRDPFSEWFPSYARLLCENMQQNGNGCDYISENVIQQADIRRGNLFFGPRSYKTIVLMSIKSLDIKTAEQLRKFVKSGGRILCIGGLPYKSSGFVDFENRDATVKSIMEYISKTYPERFIMVSEPQGNPTEWYRRIQNEYDITPYVRIDRPSKWFMQNYYKSGNKDIFFLANYNIEKHICVNLEFPESCKGKQAWIWLPESGERYKLTCENRKLFLDFEPAESKLIVFDNETGGEYYEPLKERPENTTAINGLWKVTASHVDGTQKMFEIDRLQDFNTLPMPWIRHFAGEIDYSIDIDIDNPDSYSVLDAGMTYWGVTELFVNGESVGVKWYGDRRFRIDGRLDAGKNEIRIKVTTLLGNYTKSLIDNRTAQRHARNVGYREIGLAGPVMIY